MAAIGDLVAAYWVAPITPMNRGLKDMSLVGLAAHCNVAPITPMNRGLKGQLHQLRASGLFCCTDHPDE